MLECRRCPAISDFSGPDAGVRRTALCYTRPKTRCFVFSPGWQRAAIGATKKPASTVGKDMGSLGATADPLPPPVSFSFRFPPLSPESYLRLPRFCLVPPSPPARHAFKPFPHEMSLINSFILSEGSKMNSGSWRGSWRDSASLESPRRRRISSAREKTEGSRQERDVSRGTGGE